MCDKEVSVITSDRTTAWRMACTETGGAFAKMKWKERTNVSLYQLSRPLELKLRKNIDRLEALQMAGVLLGNFFKKYFLWWWIVAGGCVVAVDGRDHSRKEETDEWEKWQHYSICMADNIRILSYIVENRSGIEAEQVTDEKTMLKLWVLEKIRSREIIKTLYNNSVTLLIMIWY